MSTMHLELAIGPIINKILLFVTILLVGAGAFDTSHAAPGYLQTMDGQFVRNNFDECWHTSQWKPNMAVAECEGGPLAPEPEAASKPRPGPKVAPIHSPEPDVVTLTLDEKALFDFDRSELKPAAREKLDAFILKLKPADDIEQLSVVGHTDRIGTDVYNDALSLRRANTIRDYLLVKEALSPNMVKVEGHGERDPLVNCSGIRGLAAIRCLAPNRRVEINTRIRRAVNEP